MRQYHVRFLFKQRHSNDGNIQILSHNLFSFSVKDKSEKPFALAFLPLIEKAGTVIQDGHRHLVVYKVSITSSFHHSWIYL
jgi:hypothetical protein